VLGNNNVAENNQDIQNFWGHIFASVFYGNLFNAVAIEFLQIFAALLFKGFCMKTTFLASNSSSY
jgi:hypothetical protein